MAVVSTRRLVGAQAIDGRVQIRHPIQLARRHGYIGLLERVKHSTLLTIVRIIEPCSWSIHMHGSASLSLTYQQSDRLAESRRHSYTRGTLKLPRDQGIIRSRQAPSRMKLLRCPESVVLSYHTDLCRIINPPRCKQTPHSIHHIRLNYFYNSLCA
jgi:hypothetical protein